MQRLREDHRFDDAAQRQIIALAAELQRAEQEGATLAELESRARAAGIDPKYVQMAVGHMQPIAQTPPVTAAVPVEAPWYRDNEITILVLGFFLVVQLITAQEVLGYGGLRSFPLFSVVATFVMGLTLSRTSTRRLTGFAALGGSLLVSVMIRFVARSVSSRYFGFDIEELAAMALVDVLVLSFAFFCAWIGRAVVNQLRDSR